MYDFLSNYIRVPMAFNGIYGPILYRFRHKARFVENRDFFHTLLHVTLPFRGTGTS